MVKLNKKILSLLLIFSLIMTLLPPLSFVSAAANINIISQATAPADENDKPDWSKSSYLEPTKVTARLIDVEIEFHGISDDDLPKLFYRVKNVDSGVTKEVKDNPAIRVGTQKVKFEKMELTEGLNKITVILDTTSQSIPAWVTYTEVATITDLKIDDRLFSDGMFAPLLNPLSEQNVLFIDGIAPNATEVKGYTNMDSEGSLAGFFYSNTGEFSFSAGESNADLSLRPGDNELVIMASNPFKTYRAERQFIYNHGGAFLYNTKIAGAEGLDATGLKDKALFKQPTILATNADGPYSINLTTDIKINRQGDQLTHNVVELQINGSEKYRATLNLVGETVEATANGTTFVVGVEPKEEYFLIKDFPMQNIGIDQTISRQSLSVIFRSSSNFPPENQNFIFYYDNKSNPYVSEVVFNDPKESPLYSGTEITVTNSTIDLIVKTSNYTEKINVYTNHQNSPIKSKVVEKVYSESGVNHFLVKLSKSDLPEGQSFIKFVPMDASDKEYLVGSKEYLVRYNPSPYIYITNIFNGKIYNTLDGEPSGIAGDGSKLQGPVLQIRPVNIDKTLWGNIRVRLNENMDLIKESDWHVVNNVFQEFRFEFGEHSDLEERKEWRLKNGLNNLIVEVYPENSFPDNPENPAKKPITTFKYELFYFSDDIPQVGALDIEKQFLLEHDFVKVEGESYRYYTQESKLKFESTVSNAAEIKIIVNRTNENGSTWQSKAVYNWDGAQFVIAPGSQHIVDVNGDLETARITSKLLELNGTGTNTVEITAANASGLFSTKVMEIVREPANFVVHYPNIDPVSRIGTINGNFTRLYVEAEGADKIIYGKDQVVDQTTPIEIGGNIRDLFVFEMKGMKQGKNKVKFTVVRGTREDEAEIMLINSNTVVPGAEFKESIEKSKIKAFSNQLELSFPKGTVLRKNDPTAPNQYLSPSRDILIGVADPVDGRVNKTLHPLRNESSKFENESDWERGYLYLIENSGRFRKASPLFWIDGGMIPLSDNQQETLFGSGAYPYERGQEFYTRTANNYKDMFVPSQTGELTLSYDKNMVESSWRYVTVFHYGYNEDYLGNKRYEWKNIGGVVNPKKNTITVPIQEFGYYTVMYMDRSFDDITGHPWARNHLETLYSKGMMRAKEASRFETNEPISRGEFATMLAKAFSIPLDHEGVGTFTDVRKVDPYSNGLYEYKYIETAARKGIIRGSLGGRFLPRENISREDAAVMIARAANLKLLADEEKAQKALEKQFTDLPKFSGYTISPVLAVTRAKLIQGKPNVLGANERKPTYYFDPKASLTRAEAAAIMMRVLLDEKKIPNL
jgi:hypothetical protein